MSIETADAIADPPGEEPQWQYRSGDMVEIERHGRLYRCGRVDDAMPDGSGLWISAEGPIARELIWRDEGFSVRMMHAQLHESTHRWSREADGYRCGPVI
jgi:hypothetical protein